MAATLEDLFERKDHLIRKHPDFNTLPLEQQNHLLNYFSNRDKTPNLDIDWNKLASYNIQDVLKATYELSKTGKEKAVKKSGIKGLEKGKDYLEFPTPSSNIKAYIPLNYEASRLIASSRIGSCEGKWCTAYQKTDEHWKKYLRRGAVFIYIIAPETKYAVATYPNSKFEVYDITDKKISAKILNSRLRINIETLIQQNQALIKKVREGAAEALVRIEKGYLKYLDGSIPVPSKDIIRELIDSDLDVSNLDVSRITDMSYLFQSSTFSGNIANWNVSNVTNMSHMFSHSCFNNDISNWDVSNVTDMSYMFEYSSFDGDISNWNVSNVTDMTAMFMKSRFNGDISSWDVSNVRNMRGMFSASAFNGNISKWNVLSVTNMSYMFLFSKFNGDISNWNVSNVRDMSGMFDRSTFNGDISNWDVANVINMSYMFSYTKGFNSDISNWNVSNVRNMAGMFMYSTFNGDISNWDVANVTSMPYMFSHTKKFNSDISNWNVANVEDMSGMFMNSNFNGDISSWDISNVINASSIFKGSPLERRYPNGLDDLRKEQRLKENALKDWLYEDF